MRGQQRGTFLFATVVAVLGFLMMTASAFAAGTEQVLLSFNYGGGTHPHAGLILDASGNLYGTTYTDGTYGAGTVFELLPGGGGQWGFEALYNFCAVTGCFDGGLSESSLIFDAAGNLYGTTSQGGNSDGCGHGCGTVFKLTNSGGLWTETVLYSFSGGSDGGIPIAGLVFDAAGNLYGTTSAGGNSTYCAGGCGVIFRLRRAANGTWKEKVLHTFCAGTGCLGGGVPNGLTIDAKGNLYCTTNQLGLYGGGTVLRFAPGANGGWTKKILHRFGKGTDGASPYGELIFDAGGSLYGTTSKGGSHFSGTVFRLTPGTNDKWTEKILHTFCSSTNCADGALPYAGVTMNSAGTLFGTTYSGGAHSAGTVFTMTPDANGRWTEAVLYDSGDNPDARLILDSAGNLYSTTMNGGDYRLGSVFEITP